MNLAYRQRANVRCRAAAQKSVPRLILANDPFRSVSSERGFLPQEDPIRRLTSPGAEAWEAALENIPKLIVAGGANGRLRSSLASLPPFPLHQLLPPQLLLSPTSTARASFPSSLQVASSFSEGSHEEAAQSPTAAGPEVWRAYYLLSFLAHAYLWCEVGAPPTQGLPPNIAMPWVTIAKALEMPPVLVYASYNLYNWRRWDQTQGIELGNLVCLQNFMASMDEEWFRVIHVAIEAKAGPAVAHLPALQQAAQQRDLLAVEQGLALITQTLVDMQAILACMMEKCDPYVYYQRVRQPMSGWRNNPLLPNGLTYKGVPFSCAPPAWRYGEEPASGEGGDLQLQLYGETGAQSTILPAFDIVLGVEHPDDWLRTYLEAMKGHMPPAHRDFLNNLKDPSLTDSQDQRSIEGGIGRGSSQREPGTSSSVSDLGAVRGVCREGQPAVKEAYNECVLQLEKFRTQHRSFANSYIAKHARKERAEAGAEIGTGGSEFMPALTGYRDTTHRHLLP